MENDPDQQYPEIPGPGGSSKSTKRKSNEGAPTQQRAKRNRYIAQACNECKRRKIKCNGENPCHRCGNLSLDCIYAPNCVFKDSEEFKSMSGQINFLHHQVERLLKALNDHGIQIEPDAYPVQDGSGYPLQQSNQQDVFGNALSPSQGRTRLVNYHGPPGSDMAFDLPVNGPTEEEIPIDKALEFAGAGNAQGPAPTATMSVQIREDPIWSLDAADAERLFSIYDEEIGKMYPIVDLQEVHQKSTFLFKFLAASKSSGLKAHFDDYPNIARDVNANITKMILANALAAESGGQNDLGKRLFQSVLEVSEKKLMDPIDGSTQVLLTLMAIQHFQMEDELQAYRVIGLIARSCLEKGLQTHQTYTQYFKDDTQRTSAMNLFWIIYALDKQWSFATGQPSTIHESIIDPTLPKPDASHPYLTVMVEYSQWACKVWHPGNSYDESSQQLEPDFIALSDYKIVEWLRSLPAFLTFDAEMGNEELEQAERGQLYRQVEAFMKISQLRLFLYRPIMQSSQKMGEHPELAREAVQIAQEVIRIISRISQHSMVVHTHPVSCYHFIVSAIATQLLAVCHRPVEFGKQVREDFKASLEFVNGFSTRSAVSHRLWKGVRTMSTAGSSLGSKARQALSAANDPHSTAAVAMAGLAGHRVDEMAVFDSSKGVMGDAPRSGSQIATELLKVFEAACEYGNASERAPGAGDTNGAGEMTLGAMYGGDQEVARLMRDLF